MSWKDRATAVNPNSVTEAPKSSWKDRATFVEPEISELESAGRGALQSASLGFSDEITGGIEALWEAAKGDSRTFGELYKQFRDESRANNDKAQEANPNAYLAGQAAGAIGTAFVPGLNIAKGASLATNVGKMALLGGATGLGESEADNLGGMVADTATGAVIGGALGGAGHKLGQVISKGDEVLTPSLTKAADNAFVHHANRAVDPTKSQLVGQADDAVLGIKRMIADTAYDQGVLQKGANPLSSWFGINPSGALDSMQDASRQAMGSVYSARNAAINEVSDVIPAGTFNNILDEVIPGITKSGGIDAAEAEVRTVLNKFADEALTPERVIQLKKELSKGIEWKSADASTKRRVVEGVLDRINQKYDEVFPSLKNHRLAELAGNKVEHGLKNSHNPSSTVNVGDIVAGSIGMMGGGVGAGGLVLGKRMLDAHGNAWAALSAKKVSQILQNNPQAFGKFSKPLQEAVQRGTFPAVHHMLQQSNPEYRQLTLGNEDNGQ